MLEFADLFDLPPRNGELKRICGELCGSPRLLFGPVEGAEPVVQFGILELRPEILRIDGARFLERVHRLVDVPVDRVRHGEARPQIRRMRICKTCAFQLLNVRGEVSLRDAVRVAPWNRRQTLATGLKPRGEGRY